MFRNRFILSALVIGAGLFLSASSVQADPFHHPRGPVGPVVTPRTGFSIGIGIGAPVGPGYGHHHHHHQLGTVYYRANCHQPWVYRGTFPAGMAIRDEHYLKSLGYEAYVVIR